MASCSGQSDIRCLVDPIAIEQGALIYASDVVSKVRCLALLAPSLGNKAELAHVLAQADHDLDCLQRLLKSS
jgi:hypothetical protein